MNKIEIEIKNFKSISDVNIKLHEKSNRVIKLIGENNAGKSNVLDAISRIGRSTTFTKDDVTLYNDSSASSTKPTIEVAFSFLDTDSNGTSENIILKSAINGDSYTYNGFDTNWTNQKYKLISSKIDDLMKTNFAKYGAFISPNNETFKQDYQFTSFRSSVAATKDETALKLVDEIRKLYSWERISKKIEVVNLKSIDLFKYTELDLGLLFEDEISNSDDRSRKQIILIWQKILKLDLVEHIANLAAAGDARQKNHLVKEFETRANKLIKDISNEFGGTLNYQFSISIIDNKLIINLTSKDCDFDEKYVWHEDPSKAGDGIKHLWSLIFRLAAIDENQAVIILIDEPEKYLNPIHQNYFSHFLSNRYKHDTKRQNQVVILTTHSPFMIGSDWYQNTFVIEREQKTNSTIMKSIYDPRNKNVPNLLLDKNHEIRYLESIWQPTKPEFVIFVEGISDYNVLKNFCPENTFIIPLFGNAFTSSAAFHIPYIESTGINYKLLVDNDSAGVQIINWFKDNSNIKPENIKKYSDFFPGKNTLEASILEPWFIENKIEFISGRKKDNSLIFKNTNTNISKFVEIIDFIKK